MELTGIAGKVAIVTGAGQGLGAAIARTLGAAGAAIVCADRNPQTVAQTEAAIRDAGGRAASVMVDVAQREGARGMVQVAADTFGGLDILVNVAGVLRVGPLLELTDEQWDETMDVNVKSVFMGSQEAARVMIRRGGGNIVNIASSAAVVPRIDQAIYGTSKAAVAHLTRCLGLELAAHHIRVNAVLPGIARTPMQEALMRDSLGLEEILVGGTLEKFRVGTPLRKMAEPQDIANAVAWLVSDQAGHVTMHSLVVDGGGSLGVSS
jgi:2,3-dihydro-2,3-dihydroxybenzoate dehydrogenase